MNFRFSVDEQAGILKLALAGTLSLPENLPVYEVTLQAATDIIGTVSTSVTIERFLAHEDDLTSIAKSGEILIQGTPEKFALHPAYPNPFNMSVTLSFSIPEDNVYIRLDIFNVLGQKVTTLLNETKTAGEYTLRWNGKDAAGNNMQSGLYFVRLEAGEYGEIQKVMLLK